MDTISFYLFISFFVFFAIAVFTFLIKIEMKMKKVSFFEALSLLFVIGGFIFGLSTAFGYALVGFGMVFLVGDLFIRFARKPHVKKKVSKNKK